MNLCIKLNFNIIIILIIIERDIIFDVIPNFLIT